MNLKPFKAIFIFSLIAQTFSGCLSMQSQTTLDGIAGAAPSKEPYVEAYIEFPGPSKKWAGPTSFIMHVMAKDKGSAQIAISPALFKSPELTLKSRGPASAKFKGMTADEARSALQKLATSLTGSEANFQGCMSPIRVRLTRADGSIVEKQGCRGQSAWSGTASATVNNFITLSMAE